MEVRYSPNHHHQSLTYKRTHVLHDLQPYQCTSEQCHTPLKLYDSQQDWALHEATSDPCCMLCQEKRSFTSPQDFDEHLKSKHSDWEECFERIRQEGKLESRILSHGVVVAGEVSAFECPFCDWETELKSRA